MRIRLAMLVLSGLAMSGAAVAHGSPDDIRLSITITCDIQHDHLDDITSGIDMEAGTIHLGSYAQDCEATTTHTQASAASSVIVDIPSGALFPDCQVSNDCFDPYTVTIPQGTGITWTNHDTVPHTVTGMQPHPDGAFDGFVLAGGEFTFTFDTPGTYWYGCSVHPWARGVITVEPYDGMADVPEISTIHPHVGTAISQVEQLLELYMEYGEDSFDDITGLNPFQEVAGLVISLDDHTILAHNTNPLFVGSDMGNLLDMASMPIDTVLWVADYGVGAWLSYPFVDTNGDIVGYERGWLREYDGYVFMARYGVTIQENIQGIVYETVRMHGMDPDNTFDTINSFMTDNVGYPFVIDLHTSSVVADGNDPNRVGGVAAVLSGSIPLDTFQGMEEGYGIWVDYVDVNPATGMEESKRSWVVMHGGYLFGAGYYP